MPYVTPRPTERLTEPFALLRAIEAGRLDTKSLEARHRRVAASAVQLLYETGRLIHGVLSHDRAAAAVYAALVGVGRGGRLTVNDFSRRAGVSRRTLHRRLGRVGLPPLSDWLRMGHILRTLDALNAHPETSQAQLAPIVGWPDSYTFSNATKQVTGYRPTQLRGRAPLSLLDEWLRTRPTATLDA